MPYTKKELRAVYDKNNGYCWHCRKKLAFENYGDTGAKGAWEVDHSRSKDKGGTDYFRNLVPACVPCNRLKRERTSSTFEPSWKRPVKMETELFGGPGPKRGQKDECFIATAAFDSPLAPEINLLRKWRDDRLMRISYGRKFVKTYYKVSPSIANLIRKSRSGKVFVRMLLRPILFVLQKRRYEQVGAS